MIQSDFGGSVGTKSIGSSGGEFELVVEALDDAGRDRLLGPKPIKDELAVRPQGTGDFLQRLETGAHYLLGRALEGETGPIRRQVVPEQLELFLEQIGADAAQVVAQQLGQLDLLRVGEVLWVLQQAPAGVGEHGIVAFGLEASDFAGADFVHGLVQACDEMEAIEYVQRMAGLLGDDLEISLPHVRADEAQLSRALASQPAEEAQECLGLAMLADPQQAPGSRIELVDDGQELIALLPGDLVDADRREALQTAVGQAPLDRPRHRPEDRIPTGVEGLGHLFPRQALSPAGKEPDVGLGQPALALSPGQFLHPYAAARTVHAPRAVLADHPPSPRRHKLVAPGGLLVVAATPLTTLRTERPTSRPRQDQDTKQRLTTLLIPPDLVIHEGGELLDPIEDSLQQHPVLPWLMRPRTPHHARTQSRMRLFSPGSFFSSHNARRSPGPAAQTPAAPYTVCNDPFSPHRSRGRAKIFTRIASTCTRAAGLCIPANFRCTPANF